MKNIAILVYGSLINKKELEGEGVDISSCVPVLLKGYRREFSQKSQRPIYIESNNSVLTVLKDGDSSLNAILVPNIKQKDLEVLDYREAGYNRVKVSLDELEFKYENIKEQIDEVYVYIGKDEFFDNTTIPIPIYLHICTTGAKQWGDEFYDDFLDTTLVQEQLLRSYL